MSTLLPLIQPDLTYYGQEPQPLFQTALPSAYSHSITPIPGQHEPVRF